MRDALYGSVFDAFYAPVPDSSCAFMKGMAPDMPDTSCGVAVLLKEAAVECLCDMVDSRPDEYALTLAEAGGLNVLFDAAKGGHSKARHAMAKALRSLSRLLDAPHMAS